MRLFLIAVGKQVSAVTQKLFGKHLLITNAVISTGMGIAGDGVQQYYEVSRGYQESFQMKRSSHMAAAGLTTGVVTHYWYALLDRWWQGRCVKVIAQKVLYDQILFSPVCLTVYFGTVAALEGSSMGEFKEELADKGGTVYVVEWLVWPIAQAFNFYYLPLRYRLAFDTVISFGFDVFTPYIKYRDQRCLGVSETNENRSPSDIHGI
ncbi:mpv17-like protein 2 [Galendromus occidentalis]|uniref:Mpv17-like protein 2 n=1 Tax=Galendromus occidentalis TaxID=34638 RepID=A0AAJ7P9Z9_9ACAR|nr:mpv17-like protein 2 [Galendromus occidentalis]